MWISCVYRPKCVLMYTVMRYDLNPHCNKLLIPGMLILKGRTCMCSWRTWTSESSTRAKVLFLIWQKDIPIWLFSSASLDTLESTHRLSALIFSLSFIYQLQKVLTALQLKSARLFVHRVFGQIHVARHSRGNSTKQKRKDMLLLNCRTVLFWGDTHLTHTIRIQCW